jgi:hypothetical protein
MTEVLAGLLGALIGGGAALIGAQMQIRAERAAASQERKDAADQALAAERILLLEGVYPALEADLPDLVEFFKSNGVETALDDALGEQLFRYHRQALAEAALERDGEAFRLLIYSEFRRRYEDPHWGLERLLAPATDALTTLSPDEMRALERQFDEIGSQLESATQVPRKR